LYVNDGSSNDGGSHATNPSTQSNVEEEQKETMEKEEAVETEKNRRTQHVQKKNNFQSFSWCSGCFLGLEHLLEGDILRRQRFILLYSAPR
jgi:hypothetical protein